MAYLIVRLLLLVAIIAKLILILVVLIFKFALVEVFDIFILKSLAGEPVDSTGDELLFDVLTKLVVELEALLNVRGDTGSLVIVLVLGGLGWVKEVEE